MKSTVLDRMEIGDVRTGRRGSSAILLFHGVMRWIELLNCGLLIALVFVYASQVLSRYGWKHPILWADELSCVFLIWISFGGALLALEKGEHLTIDLLPKLLPPAQQARFGLLAHLLSLIFLLALSLLGLGVVAGTMGQTAVSLPLARGWIYLPALVYIVLMALISAGKTLFLFRGLRKKE